MTNRHEILSFILCDLLLFEKHVDPFHIKPTTGYLTLYYFDTNLKESFVFFSSESDYRDSFSFKLSPLNFRILIVNTSYIISVFDITKNSPVLRQINLKFNDTNDGMIFYQHLRYIKYNCFLSIFFIQKYKFVFVF